MTTNGKRETRHRFLEQPRVPYNSEGRCAPPASELLLELPAPVAALRDPGI